VYRFAKAFSLRLEDQQFQLVSMPKTICLFSSNERERVNHSTNIKNRIFLLVVALPPQPLASKTLWANYRGST
jgi:hypothetical protein